MSRRRVILAVVSMDGPSAVALRRALALSEAFAARLHVVAPLASDSKPLVESENWAAGKIAQWAATKAKVILSRRQVEVGLADVRTIARAVRRVDAGLLVVGSTDDSNAPGSSSRLSLASVDVARSLSRAVLITQPPKSSREVIVATDLRDDTCHVVTTAAHFAAAVAGRMTLVHTFRGEKQTRNVRAVPRYAERIRRLSSMALNVQGIRAGHVALDKTATDVIVDVANDRGADLAVVGLRGGRTLYSLLDRMTCSVLAVPVAGKRDDEPDARE